MENFIYFLNIKYQRLVSRVPNCLNNTDDKSTFRFFTAVLFHFGLLYLALMGNLHNTIGLGFARGVFSLEYWLRL